VHRGTLGSPKTSEVPPECIPTNRRLLFIKPSQPLTFVDKEAAMSPIPRDPDALLSRPAVAEALTESGYPIKAKTLATMVSRGGGPPYRLFGARALYRWGDALSWAESRLSAPRASTSEADVARVSHARLTSKSEAPVPKRGRPRTPPPTASPSFRSGTPRPARRVAK
jgi:hypothetical protein